MMLLCLGKISRKLLCLNKTITLMRLSSTRRRNLNYRSQLLLTSKSIRTSSKMMLHYSPLLLSRRKAAELIHLTIIRRNLIPRKNSMKTKPLKHPNKSGKSLEPLRKFRRTQFNNKSTSTSKITKTAVKWSRLMLPKTTNLYHPAVLLRKHKVSYLSLRNLRKVKSSVKFMRKRNRLKSSSLLTWKLRNLLLRLFLHLNRSRRAHQSVLLIVRQTLTWISQRF